MQNNLNSYRQLLPIPCTVPATVAGDPATFPVQKAVACGFCLQVGLTALHQELAPPQKNGALRPPSTTHGLDTGWGQLPRLPIKITALPKKQLIAR